jgi:hypothetical protein
MGKKGCNLLIEALTNDLYQVNGKGAFYNPQNEMLPFHKTKCSETQNEASSL